MSQLSRSDFDVTIRRGSFHIEGDFVPAIGPSVFDHIVEDQFERMFSGRHGTGSFVTLEAAGALLTVFHEQFTIDPEFVHIGREAVDTVFGQIHKAFVNEQCIVIGTSTRYAAMFEVTDHGILTELSRSDRGRTEFTLVF